MTQESKACTRCHQEKPLSEFYPRQSRCKICLIEDKRKNNRKDFITCSCCQKTLSRFRFDGRAKTCKCCQKIASHTITIKNIPLTGAQLKWLGALKDNPMKLSALLDRMNTGHRETLLILIKKGLVDQDDTGFYSLTDLGKYHAPYRNQHLKARVIKKIAGEFFSDA